MERETFYRREAPLLESKLLKGHVAVFRIVIRENNFVVGQDGDSCDPQEPLLLVSLLVWKNSIEHDASVRLLQNDDGVDDLSIVPLLLDEHGEIHAVGLRREDLKWDVLNDVV